MSGIEGTWSSLRKSHLLDKERRLQISYNLIKLFNEGGISL